jgi:2-aminoadipate transaminase
MGFEWRGARAERVRGLGVSEIRKALTAAADPGLLSFAGGIPAPELFPVDEFRTALDRAIRDEPENFLQYGPTEGHPALREYVADKLRWCGMRCTAGQVVIVNGSQQGLDLVGRLMLDPGDRVLVEDPSYVGAIDAFRQYQAGFTVVPTDAEGIRVDAVAECLRRDRGPGGPRRIRLLYTMPNYANPSGLTMSLKRRKELVELSHRFGLPVVEDDAYGELRFDGPRLPSLSSLDCQGTVIYLGTLSKVLAPGLRIGWVVAQPDVVKPLLHLKERSDLHSAIGSQIAAVNVLSNGFHEPHVERLVHAYRQRRDAMVAAVAEHFPAGTQWQRPDGGFFLWCTLPAGTDSGVLLREAMTRARVAFVPGRDFHAGAARPDTIRLNYSGVTPAAIHDGIGRLGALLHETGFERSLKDSYELKGGNELVG